MCGIAGIIGVVDADSGRVAMERMLTSLARRGPDDEGMAEWNGAILGHRRLSIFDVSSLGHQPMASADGSLGVVFNGAIYNFQELRTELLQRGYTFKSQTDTEVLLHGYQEWGLRGLVQRLRGMFAFGLWDNRLQKLYLVRDRLGVKPLLFAVDRGMLAFASTTRALKVAGVAGTINDDAVTEFFRYGFITDDRSIYQEVRKVPAGGIIEWCQGTLTQHLYWEVPTWEEQRSSLTFQESVEVAERLLVEAVRLRLEADVPVGALLSGGIDSALVCWAISYLGGDVQAYTVGTPGDEWDETHDAKRTACKLGIRHEILNLSEQEVPQVDELVTAYSEPFACESGLGMLGVSKIISRNAKVLLTGDGGDDLFLGYPEHRYMWAADRFRRYIPRSVSHGWVKLGSHRSWKGSARRAASFLDYSTKGLQAVLEKQCWLREYDQKGILGERILQSPQYNVQMRWNPEDELKVFQDFLDHHQRTRFLGQYLPKVDGATMHYGLEARSPFLDQTMWEWGVRLSPTIRLHRGALKAILRELARRKLGHEVADRQKRGFGIPVHRWVQGWSPSIKRMLKESHLEQGGWIQVRSLWEKDTGAGRCSPTFLWYAYVMEMWLRHEGRLDSTFPAQGRSYRILQRDSSVNSLLKSQVE